MSQVVGNLLSNAIKYSPDGGEVRVSARRNGGDALIAVSDDGVGIRAEDVERIFEKFYRAPEATRTVGGTGLGLAVAREIVVSHGGLLRVDSTPGAGSMFVVTVPLQTPPIGASRMPRRDMPVDTSSHEAVQNGR
jgi:signal transduction histidine kinase